mmetsp:Transcript_9466/g.29353  ORF Transcript_9466/g.29353 Transcript_9466/m.29353 type:complete len:218 (+) Transcript_9466:542-1195(+)
MKLHVKVPRVGLEARYRLVQLVRIRAELLNVPFQPGTPLRDGGALLRGRQGTDTGRGQGVGQLPWQGAEAHCTCCSGCCRHGWRCRARCGGRCKAGASNAAGPEPLSHGTNHLRPALRHHFPRHRLAAAISTIVAVVMLNPRRAHEDPLRAALQRPQHAHPVVDKMGDSQSLDNGPLVDTAADKEDVAITPTEPCLSKETTLLQPLQGALSDTGACL